MTSLSRDELVAFAQESIARGSKSFAAASRLFDRQTRERVWLLYAWCRACDDLADGQDHGGVMSAVADPAARMDYMRLTTAQALKGKVVDDPPFDALRIVAAETGLTQAMADAVLDGFALDAQEWGPRSEDDLYKYCYHVAGAVGVMMAVVMGVAADDEATLDRACDLGLTFQLSNIARDLMEDDAAGRCYLPEEWLCEADICPGEIMKPHNRAAASAMAARMVDMGERFEASARVGAAALPFRARWAVLSAAGIYGDIGRKIRAGGDHAWDHRVYTSKAEKLRHVAAALGAAVLNRPAPASRDGLWTRPKV